MFKNFKIVDYMNYLILLYAFVLSFPVEIKRVLIFAMIFLWLIDREKYDFRLKDSEGFRIFLAFFLFVLFVLLSYFWSEASLYLVLKYIDRYWYFIPVFIIYKYIKKDYILYSINSFLLGMLISEILSYGNFFGIWRIGLKHSSTVNPTVFIQHTLYGVFLSICIVILFLNTIYTKELKSRVMYGLFFLTATTNLLVNSGRTGYFTFFITIFIVIVYLSKLNIKIAIATLVTIVLTITTAYNFSHNFHVRINQIKHDIVQVVKHGNYRTSVGARIGLSVIAENIFADHPFLGAGAVSNIKLKKEYIEDKKIKKFKPLEKYVHFHNSFLEILTQFGLIGFGIFMSIIYFISQIKIEDKMMNVIKIATLSVFILGSLTDMLFYLNATMSLFALMVGLFLAQNRYESLAIK